MEILCKHLYNNDLQQLIDLIKVYEDTFEMENFTLPNVSYLQTLLEKESTIFFVAEIENKVIGGLTAHILPSTYFTSSEVYIFDLAVKTDFQRQGIGSQLINSLKNYCTLCGYQEMFVQANLEDRHAIDFYRTTGGTAESVVHFSYELKEN